MDPFTRLEDSLVENVLWRVGVIGERDYALVCRRWRLLSYRCHPCLRLQPFGGTRLLEEQFLERIRLFTGVKTLHVTPGSLKRISDATLETAASLWSHSLVTLDVQGVGSSLTQDGLSNFLAAVPRLKCLRLAIFGEPFPLDIPLRHHSTPLQLVSLELQCIRLVPPSIAELRFLRRLSLQRCSFKTLPKHLARLPLLEALEVSSCPFLESLPPELPPTLKHLRLVDLPSLAFLPSSVARLRCLQLLQIVSCPGVPRLPQGLPAHKVEVSLCPHIQHPAYNVAANLHGKNSCLAKKIGGPGTWPVDLFANTHPSSVLGTATPEPRVVPGSPPLVGIIRHPSSTGMGCLRRSSRSHGGSAPRVSWGTDTWVMIPDTPTLASPTACASPTLRGSTMSLCCLGKTPSDDGDSASTTRHQGPSRTGVSPRRVLFQEYGEDEVQLERSSKFKRIKMNQAASPDASLLRSKLEDSSRASDAHAWGQMKHVTEPIPEEGLLPLERSHTWDPAALRKASWGLGRTHAGGPQRWLSLGWSRGTGSPQPLLGAGVRLQLSHQEDNVGGDHGHLQELQVGKPQPSVARRPSLRTQVLRLSTAKIHPHGHQPSK